MNGNHIILDPHELERRRREKRITFHSRQVPALRVIGNLCLTTTVLIYNAVVPDTPSWLVSVGFFSAVMSYSLLSWVVLRLCYRRVRRVDLGELFLLLDLLVHLGTIYSTGGSSSLFLIVLVTRVVDQATTSFKRVVFFNHYYVAGYLLFLVLWGETLLGPLSWPAELVKLSCIYLFNWYFSLTALTAHRLRHVNRVAIQTARKELQHRLQMQEDLERQNNVLRELNHELHSALEEIKVLRGIIPICSHCKNVRDDQGYWNRLEEYLTAHSHASLSHGICPECAEKFFPGITEEEEP